MTDPIETSAFQARIQGPSLVRLAAAGLIIVATLAVAVAILGGGSPSTVVGAEATASSSAAPDASAAPRVGGRAFDGRRGGPGHGFGGPGGPITISTINGSSVALQTADGWSRTVVVGSDTTVTRGGTEIAVADLKVGDEVRLRQTRNADGSFSVTEIAVVEPAIGGTVSAVSGNAITVSRPDGSTATIHVSASTTYRIAGVDSASLADVAADMRIIATGTLRADGSLDASRVVGGKVGDRPGDRGGHFFGGPGGKGPFGGPWGQPGPDKTPTPTPTPTSDGSAS